VRIGLAFKLFFKALTGGKTADALEAVLQGKEVLSPASKPVTLPEPVAAPAVPKPQVASRSEALTLLATLQREARLLDLVQEPLEQYPDAQVGAAARDVLRDTRKVLERAFGIKPLIDVAEGSSVELPSSPSPMLWKISGSQSLSASAGSKKMMVVHPGWKADHCQLPVWNGSSEDALVLAPAEVENNG